MLWECPEPFCRLKYRLNPVVHRWYRNHPLAAHHNA
jgi:hypothetical protein